MLLSPTLLALALVLFLLLLAPTRRLQLAGWPPRALGSYLAGMLVLGLAVTEMPVIARFAVPILLVGYLAPFVTLRAGLDRLAWLWGSRRVASRDGVRVERPPLRVVTGPARDVEPSEGEDRGVDPKAGSSGE